MAFDTRVIIAACLLGISFVLYTTSNAIPSWSKITVENNEITTGLWQFCRKVTALKLCVTFKCDEDEALLPKETCRKILSARAFVTLACILSGITALTLCLVMITKNKIKQIILLIGKCLSIACLVMGIIGVVIGIESTINSQPGMKFKMAAASIIGIVAVIINLFGAIMTALIRQ